MSDASGADAPATQTTPSETTRSPQILLKAEFKLLATYLANAWVPEEYRTALEQIYDTENFCRAAKGPTTYNSERDSHSTRGCTAASIESRLKYTSAALVRGSSRKSVNCSYNCCTYSDKAGPSPAQKRDHSHKGQGVHNRRRPYEPRIHRTIE